MTDVPYNNLHLFVYVYTHVSNTYDTCVQSGMLVCACVVCRYREGKSEKSEHAREGNKDKESEKKTGGGRERERKEKATD